jgi:long-chain acyl-CoA synthetase
LLTMKDLIRIFRFISLNFLNAFKSLAMLKELFVQFLEQGIKNNWEIQSLSDYKGETFQYSEVGTHIYKLHQLFRDLEIEPGDKIALIGKNSARWGIVYLSVVTYGAVIVPILPDFKPEDVQEIINHSDSVLLFSSDSIFETLDTKQLKNIRATISVNTFRPLETGSTNLEEKIDRIEQFFSSEFPKGLNADDFSIEPVANSMLAVISYTSGTTGHSKGVMLSHNSLAANIRFAQNNMPLNPGDPIVSFLPLAHAYGVAFEFLFPFSIGCHITFLTKTPSPQIIMQAFKEIKPALVLSVPLVIEKIFKKQLMPVIEKPHMKVLLALPGTGNLIRKKIRKKLVDVFGGNFTEVVIGGAAFNPEAELFFKKIAFPFTVGYGMTECGPLISYASWEVNRLGASGKAVDTLEVKIDSPDPEKIVGEILIKGENVMEGYYKNKEATQDVIDNEGWLHSGDLGIIDQDGFIYIKGRSKSLILGASGKNIYPEELESMFNNKFCVTESVVVDRNDKLVALIYPDAEVVEKNSIDEAQLAHMFEHYRKEVNERVPAYMQIAKIEVHNEEFEKTPKRSIKRYLYS